MFSSIYFVSLVVFLSVVLLLVGVLLLVESQLTVKGDCRILINDDADKSIHTRSGNTLLGTLVEKEYDTQGNVTKETDAFGHETNFTYDDNGNQLTLTTTRTTASGTVTMIWEKTSAPSKIISIMTVM